MFSGLVVIFRDKPSEHLCTQDASCVAGPLTLCLPPFYFMLRLVTLPLHKYIVLATVALAVFVVAGRPASAATVKALTDRPAQLVVPTTGQTFSLFDGKFRGGANIAIADLGGDGDEEFIVGAGSNGGPQVEIYNSSGKKVRSFFVFNKTTKAGVNIAAGDLDNDGKAEIVVTPQLGYAPTVEVYDGNGKRKTQFYAFEKSYSGGVRIAVLPARTGQSGKIIAASGLGRDMEVRIFDLSGHEAIKSYFPYGKKVGDGVTVAAGYSQVIGEPVIILGGATGKKPMVQVYGLTTKKVQRYFLAYTEPMRAGVWVGYTNDTIITGPNLGGGPDIRVYDLNTSTLENQYLVFESNYRGGVRVALTSTGAPVVTSASQPNDQVVGAGKGKRIIVDLSEQKLKLIENGRVISVRTISTGKWLTPTPTGEYKTRNKIVTAYSKPYGLYMEYWMAFTADGSYGLHSLPYWKLGNGGRLYEGANHLGTPVSHGCIRQSLADAKSLYDWAPVGTPVTITK